MDFGSTLYENEGRGGGVLPVTGDAVCNCTYTGTRKKEKKRQQYIANKGQRLGKMETTYNLWNYPILGITLTSIKPNGVFISII